MEYRNKITEMILSDKELHDQVQMVCCIKFFEELIPLKEIAEEYKFNIDGEAFGDDGCGGYFLYLSDGTIGYANFAESECGRIANSLKELMELTGNCAYGWYNYLSKRFYENHEHLRKFILGLEYEGKCDYENAFGEDVPEYEELLEILAEKLEFSVYENIVDDVILPFYKTVEKQPAFETVGEDKLNSLFH